MEEGVVLWRPHRRGEVEVEGAHTERWKRKQPCAAGSVGEVEERREEWRHVRKEGCFEMKGWQVNEAPLPVCMMLKSMICQLRRGSSHCPSLVSGDARRGERAERARRAHSLTHSLTFTLTFTRYTFACQGGVEG